MRKWAAVVLALSSSLVLGAPSSSTASKSGEAARPAASSSLTSAVATAAGPAAVAQVVPSFRPAPEPALLSPLATTPGTAAVSPRDYAPVDQPGPPLSVPVSLLAEALACTGDMTNPAHTPVLLVPGTGVNPEQNFSWNWERALAAQSWPFCTITLPGSAMADIQVAGEYIVYSIRAMHQLAGRRISVVGHSQGGMVPRWALRFWPDTRPMVDDLVGVAPSNHGSLTLPPLCTFGCAPAFWQQGNNARFIAALNSGQETFQGISYTVVYTRTDYAVTPNFDATGSSSLHGGWGAITNVAIQEVCPLDLVEHLSVGTWDNTAYAIAIDALTRPGPADPNRVPRSVCLNPLQPGVNPLTFATDSSAATAYLAVTLATYPHVAAEPPLACYVTMSCPS